MAGPPKKQKNTDPAALAKARESNRVGLMRQLTKVVKDATDALRPLHDAKKALEADTELQAKRNELLGTVRGAEPRSRKSDIADTLQRKNEILAEKKRLLEEQTKALQALKAMEKRIADQFEAHGPFARGRGVLDTHIAQE